MKKSDPSASIKTETPPPATVAEENVSLTLNSASRIQVSLALEPGSEVIIKVEKRDIKGKEIEVIETTYSNPQTGQPAAPVCAPSPLHSKLRRLKTLPSWQIWLLIAACLVYLTTRFIGLDSFPIYFFTDEAVQTVLAADLVRDGMQSYTGEVLPTFLVNGSQYNLGTSVYVQVLPWLIFGKSVWVTRGTSVLLSLIAALAVGLTFKNVLKSRYAFAAVLLLSLTPAWFLHSRTAFEVVIAVSFYAGFLYTYLMYRYASPRYLFPSIVFGALAFYSYSPAQLVLAVTALLFLISDWRYHLKHWKTILVGLGITLVLTVPYIRFLILHPDENIRHLKILNSYWIQTMPFMSKIGIYLKEYLKLLNPLYWFIPNQFDLNRHLMKGYGHLWYWTLPFFLLGVGVAVRHIKKPVYRAILIALLAAPAGSALAGAAITRAMFLIIPAVLLTALGLEQAVKWLEKIHLPRFIFPLIVFLGLSTANLFMLRDALKNGPIWYQDYGLAGQQYGAQQVFGEIKSILDENPNAKIRLSPTWANGTDVLTRFFFPDPVPFEMGSLDGLMFSRQEITPGEIFILMPDEYEKARTSGKFTNIQLLKTLPYPNGQPGFYFVTMDYVDSIDQILAQEHLARQELKETSLISSDGTALEVRYPVLDMGEISQAFDSNDLTMIRSIEANPMRMEIHFDQPRLLNSVTFSIGGTATTFDLEIFPADGSASIKLHKEVLESNDYRDIEIALDEPVLASDLVFSILNTYDGEPSHVHLWDVAFK